MNLRDTARDIYIGRCIDVYWRVQRDGDEQRTSRQPTHEWKWFVAKVTDVSYMSTRETEKLQATLLYDKSADFDEVSCKVTFLTSEEFKDDESGALFSFRLHVDDCEESDDGPPQTSPDDEEYVPFKSRNRKRVRNSSPDTISIPRWRQSLSRPRHLEAERRTTSLISKIQDMEQKVISHDLLIHRHIAEQRDLSVQQHHVSIPVLTVPPVLFLAARTLEILERTPPPPSKMSQASKHAHKKLPHQNWFEADAECTLHDFDKICVFIAQQKKGEVTFRPSFEELTVDIRPEYEVIFHNFRSLLWVLGAHSNQAVDNILLKVRYDGARISHSQQGEEPRQERVAVGIDLFGCLLHDAEESTNPSYITIGQGEEVLRAESRALIGRPDSSWSHIESAFVHRRQVLQVENSLLQQTYTRWKQGMKGHTPFSMKWKGLRQQLLRATNIFSSPNRNHVLGKLSVHIPYVSIRDTMECKHFMEAFEQISKN